MTFRRFLIFCLILTVYGVTTAQQVDKDRLLNDLKYLSSPKLKGRAPMTEGSRLAQNHIIARFTDIGFLSQFREYRQSFALRGKGFDRREAQGVNIVGFVPGAVTERIIVVLAHYDHLGERDGEIFLGADDNASGVTGLLSLAQYFAENRPEHSMLFAALDAEELGLQGAKALLADFPFPVDQIELVVNMDMISRSDRNTLFAVGSRHYPELKPILLSVDTPSNITLVLGNDGGEEGAQDWTNASDHAPFHEAGIPFVYFGVDDHPDYHKPSDTFENIDPDFFADVVELILEFLKAKDATATP